MKQRVSLKLLVLFGIICTTFIFAESKLHAATVANKSSTFSTQLNNRDDDGGNDSELAEKIRAQRAAIEARENRDAATTQTKTSAKQNNCDNDLRKCISAQCGANYKKCETDSDITFSDKLTACRKETTCTAHEFTLFTNEIKEDKKQAIDLAMYNTVIDCGNSYNDCIIQQCGPKFNKCLSKSNGDNAIAACKQIAQNCTEADSALVGRIGNVFGIVRQDAEKQIKADETKLQQLRDKMRSSCRATGAMFDDRTLDCVFNVSFYAGDDQKTPKASRKLYAGSLFDCTPDWFGIDVTTFKENAYRLTRSQTAASSAMLGAGVGTAVGAITSGAIGRAIDTKKAKDALQDECEKAGKTVKDGKCVDKEADDNDDDEENEEESLTPKDKCESEASGGTWNETTKKCDCPANKEPDGDECIDQKKKTKCLQNGGKKYILGKCICENDIFEFDGEKCVESESKKAKKEEKDNKQASQKCTKTGGTYNPTTKECECDTSKGLMKSNNTPGTCNCLHTDLRTNNYTVPALNKSGMCSFLHSDQTKKYKDACSKYGKSTLTDTGCSCNAAEHFAQIPLENVHKLDESTGKAAIIPGYFKPNKCGCETGYEMKDNKCVKKSNTTSATQTHNNQNTSLVKPSKTQRREQASQEIANEEAANQMINNAMNNLLHGNNEFK